jgi:hypothetical protein
MTSARDKLFDVFEKHIEQQFRCSGGLVVGGRQHSHLTVDAIRQLLGDDPHTARVVFDYGFCAAVEYLRLLFGEATKEPQ